MRTVRIGEATFGAGRIKVVVPVLGADLESVLEHARAVAARPAGQVDLVEWRADALVRLDPAQVAAIGAALAEVVGRLPVLFTVRTAGQGGGWSGSDQEYASLLAAAASSGLFAALDVEAGFDPSVTGPVIEVARAAGVVVIVSHHDFVGTPAQADLVAMLLTMQERGGDLSKLAVTPHRPEDVLTLLAATNEMSTRYARQPIITIAMGALGTASRLVGEVFGSCATFATVGSASAPGQLPLDSLLPVLELVHDTR